MIKRITLAYLVVVGLILIGTNVFAVADRQPSAGSGDLKGGGPSGPTITMRLPLTSPDFADIPAAIVNRDEITLADLNEALSSSHEGVGEDKKQAAKIDYSKILKRLINVRLIMQEARNIGLDELPETKELVRKYSETTRKELLIRELTKDVKADEKDVEKLYRDEVKEFKIKSVMFKKEEDARKLADEIKSGKSFDELSEQTVRDGLAQGGGEGQFVKPKSLQPSVAAALQTIDVGSVSPVVQIGTGKNDTGYIVFKVEDVRYADDAAAEAKARQAVLESKKDEAVKKFKREIYKKEVVFKKKLINSLNYEAKKPGFEALLKDKRVIATVRNAKPITVGNLSRRLGEKFYHGVDSAVEAKRINAKKIEVLEEMIDRILFDQEATKRKVDETERYQSMVRDYEGSVLFGTFIDKVVSPDVKVSTEEITSYYQEHAAEFTYPEMMKIDGLAFESMKNAEAALAKLRQGTDFSWLKTNAENQVDKNTKGLLSFEPNLMFVSDFPEEMKKALAGARSGDFRTFAGPENIFYVLTVQEVVPPKQQALDEVKGDIRKKIYLTKLKKLIEDWADKLRAAAEITIYVVESGS